MRRRAALSTVLIVSMATIPLGAVSNPVIGGAVSGVELCPQSICGAAVFAGNFTGIVNTTPVKGIFSAAITHDSLPVNAGDTAAITGGVWIIHTRDRSFSGVIAPGGMLVNNGDNTFTVTLTMVITRGGFGTLNFVGLLNHNTFPPTIIGLISQ